MTALFERILNMSITSSIVILAVIGIRFALRRVPKIFSYILWAVVLFRLICPVSLPSPVALLGFTAPQVTAGRTVTSVAYLPAEVSAQVPFAPVSAEQTEPAALSATMTPYDIGMILWLLGIGVLALYSAVMYLRLRRELAGAMALGDGVYLADNIGSAFVLGVLRPKVYLPSRISPRERVYILAHERHHIRRWDHVWKLLAWAALCLHWFNPLVWVAFILAGKDMEMSCDEAVIGKLGSHVRADYAQSLLRLATHQRVIAFTPLAFGEGDTKGRVKNMAKWKKPGVWLCILCSVLCVAVLAACGLNPQEKPREVLQLEEITVTLPEEYTCKTSPRGGVSFLMEEETVGGVELYILPVEMPEAEYSVSELAEAIGLEETVMEMMAYMGGSSAYGDMEINYFYELDPAGWNRTHTFFCSGDRVYDIWFDENKVPAEGQKEVLMTAVLEKLTERGSAAAEEDPAGDLARCKAVVDMVQSSESFCVKVDKTNEGGNVLNDSSTIWYYRDGENWLQYHEIPVQGILDGVPVWCNKFAYMYADGIYYDNMRDGRLDEELQVTWNESVQQEVWVPWLSAYRWVDEEITYISTLPEGSGSAVTLQIDAPYKGREDAYPSYYVVFHFDEAGAFRHVDVEASFHCEGASDLHTVEREGIFSMDQEFIVGEISRQHARALGE